MILHIVIDDKFTEYVLKQFGHDSSRYVVITHPNGILTHVEHLNVENIAYQSAEYRQLLSELGNFSALVLHGLFEPWQENLILQVPPSVKVAWFFYGGEVYGRDDLQKNFLSTRTRMLAEAKKLVYIFKRKPHVKFFQVSKAVFRHINYCLTDVREEYEYVKHYANDNMKWLQYTCYSIEETLGYLTDCRCSGNKILLGNSSTFENNHLDAFHALRTFDLSPKQVITPLSYGDPWLRQRLLKIGNLVLGASFAPLTDFMPRDDYNKILQSCSIGIFPHYRPQAFGNIITMLWLGAKIYMSKSNIGYCYFSRLGIKLFTLEDDLDASNKKALLPLEKKWVAHNRSILLREYGQVSMRSRISQIINILNQ